MKMERQRLMLASMTGFGVVVGWLVVVLFSFGKAPVSGVLPNPNGYDDLLAAGSQLGEHQEEKETPETLARWVASNGETLRLLRQGLRRPCRVPTESIVTNLAANVMPMLQLKKLAKLLRAEGRLAESEGRNADAARSYIDAVKLGSAMSSGGLMINRLVGVACEGVGMIPLVVLVPKIQCDELKTFSKELEQIDGSTVAWSEVARNEARFARLQLQNQWNPIELARGYWENKRSVRSSKERHVLACAHLRLTFTEMALRGWRCGHGAPPDSLDQLVPEFLPTIPADPFSGNPLVYRRIGTNWVLYSVGPDRKDDGGSPIGKVLSGDDLFWSSSRGSKRGQEKGDLRFDSPW